MALRLAARYVSRRLSSSSGKILSEEEKAAENVYFKKMEKEKMEKLSHQGAKPEDEQAAAAAKAAPEAESTLKVSIGSSTSQASTDTNRNYSVVAGTIAIVSGLGWYLLSKPKKTEQVQD